MYSVARALRSRRVSNRIDSTGQYRTIRWPFRYGDTADSDLTPVDSCLTWPALSFYRRQPSEALEARSNIDAHSIHNKHTQRE